MPVAGAFLGAIQLGVGLVNSDKAKAEAARLANIRPQYKISPEVGKNLALTESELANGLGVKTEKAYADANERAYSSSISAILKAGGDINNVGDVYGTGQEGRLKLAELRNNFRLYQIQNVIKARENKQQEQQTQWQLNQFAPWQDKAQAAGQARIAAAGQINQGFNTFGSAFMQPGGFGGGGQATGSSTYLNQQDWMGQPISNTTPSSASLRSNGSQLQDNSLSGLLPK